MPKRRPKIILLDNGGAMIWGHNNTQEFVRQYLDAYPESTKDDIYGLEYGYAKKSGNHFKFFEGGLYGTKHGKELCLIHCPYAKGFKAAIIYQP